MSKRKLAFDVGMTPERIAAAEALWTVALRSMLDPTAPEWKDKRQQRMMTMACAVQMLVSYAITQDDDIGPVLQALPYACGVTVGQADPERAQTMARAVMEAYAQGISDGMDAPPPPVVGRA